MANVTFDTQWRESMRDLMDLLEMDPVEEEQTEEEAFQHHAFLYIKYVQVYKNLEECYDNVVHPQKRRDILVVLEAVMGRMLEIKDFLIRLRKSQYINLDDILVDLKLIPEILELPVPRYFTEDRRKVIEEREKLLEKLMEQYQISQQAEEEKEEEEGGEFD
eukprot:CAMPEP_0113878750 /NCGR_PEP_ID=MMETSP0780_2-20120614/6859_1 /TAXON_ID=652834 /ORGANISM="Palpitomonas bilix" /LENGTH=161 /DNA_ID=CAMNT_0000865261 /DNA_START=105 /DNA_END=587 /DNA_ORIENTATION=- /assembly_acc=CAM_ASM_000599